MHQGKVIHFYKLFLLGIVSFSFCLRCFVGLFSFNFCRHLEHDDDSVGQNVVEDDRGSIFDTHIELLGLVAEELKVIKINGVCSKITWKNKIVNPCLPSRIALVRCYFFIYL